MPFFPRFHYPATSTYPAFPTMDLFRLLEETQNEADHSVSGATSRRAFSPNFDVHETEKEYVLEGELPGLDDKKKLSLEFTDDKTLLVRGKIERSVKRWSDDQGKIHSIEGDENKAGENKEVEKSKEGETKKEEKPKYWVSERTVGEFSRSFSFPGTIDIDAVQAGLEHGILKIVVPKKEKPASRRIELN
jgi:HSP20 family protein